MCVLPVDFPFVTGAFVTFDLFVLFETALCWVMPGNAVARKKEVCSQRVSNWDFDVLSTTQGHLRTLVSEKWKEGLLCEVWDQSWHIIIDELESRILWLTCTSQLTVSLFWFMESLVFIHANARYPFPRNAYIWHSAWEQLVRRRVILAPATVVNKSEALSLRPCMWFCAPFWVLSSARCIHLPNRCEIIQVIIWSCEKYQKYL